MIEREIIDRDDALMIVESKALDKLTVKERVIFQLSNPRLCMDFGQFQKEVEEVIGRGVWTHEFADPRHLILEVLKVNEND